MAVAETELLSSLRSTPHAFLQPTPALYASSLDFLQKTLDPLAAAVSEAQNERLQRARRKRKRGDRDEEEQVLRLKKLHVQGFSIEQIWAQAKQVIDAATREAERDLERLQAQQSQVQTNGVGSSNEESLEDEGEQEGDDLNSEDLDQDEDLEDLDEDVDSEEASDLEPQPQEEYKPDPNGLNDGFFSINDFNRQSEFLEQADARGDNDGAASDEEEVDWNTDPLGTQAPAIQDQDDESQEDGPTFGNADLNAPEGASEYEDEDIAEGDLDGMGTLDNTNNVLYADFFAPPARKAGKKKKGRPNPHNFPAKEQSEDQTDEAIERTMSAVHRDLFEDDTEDEEEEGQDLDPGDPRSRKSTHERRRAALAEEIRKLEAANVAKRDWTLSGEAVAADRPQNSLLEEDLDFERAGKPVPVITAEISESIEELIKRRILAQDFNDIIRRRPDDLATGRDARRGRQDYELSDAKSKKSLAEMYEDEHQRRTDPNYIDEKDEKTRKEQNEILALWRDVCGKLDSLSSWNFKPRQPAPQLDIRVDAPVVRLEDARPTAGAEASVNMLAPQEIYKAGEAVDKEGEVVTRGGGIVSKEELSRDDRKRRRRRAKERARKALDGGTRPKESKKTTEQKDMVADLKRGGVKVIGNKGELQDVHGRKVKAIQGQTVNGAGAYKL